jgi:hypothetical protein
MAPLGSGHIHSLGLGTFGMRNFISWQSLLQKIVFSLRETIGGHLGEDIAGAITALTRDYQYVPRWASSCLTRQQRIMPSCTITRFIDEHNSLYAGLANALALKLYGFGTSFKLSISGRGLPPDRCPEHIRLANESKL